MSFYSEEESHDGNQDVDCFSDVYLDDDEKQCTMRSELCNGMTPKKYLLMKNEGNTCDYWNEFQTTTLYRALEAGNYNLSRIKRTNCCFGRKTLVEIHDRALVLLVLQKMMFKDPVSFLHSNKPKEHLISLSTWMKHTKNFERYFMLYHDLSKWPVDVEMKVFMKKKIIKAYKIFNHYNAFYDAYKGNFDWCFADLRTFNME